MSSGVGQEEVEVGSGDSGSRIDARLSLEAEAKTLYLRPSSTRL